MLTIVQFFSTDLECPQRWSAPTGQCSPVSVLDRQVLFHSFHQVPEALAKDFLLGERLAVYQTRPQFTEILLGDRAVSGSGFNSKPDRREVAGSQVTWGLLGLTRCSGICIQVHPAAEVYSVPRCTWQPHTPAHNPVVPSLLSLMDPLPPLWGTNP